MSADKQLKAYIDRVLRLKEEQDTLGDDIREIYAEAKADGYDKTIMGKLVAHLRKVQKSGEDAVSEQEMTFDTYLTAYHRASGTAVATHTHEEEFDAITGEFIEGTGSAAPLQMRPETVRETPSADIRVEGREVGDDVSSVESEGSVPGHQLDDAAASLNESDDDAIAAVNLNEGLANVADVEPSSSAPNAPSVTEEATGILADDALADANTGGSHVDAHEDAATDQAGSQLVSGSRPANPLRPNCLKPDSCGGYGSKHCHSCSVAAREAETA